MACDRLLFVAMAAVMGMSPFLACSDEVGCASDGLSSGSIICVPPGFFDAAPDIITERQLSPDFGTSAEAGREAAPDTSLDVSDGRASDSRDDNSN